MNISSSTQAWHIHGMSCTVAADYRPARLPNGPSALDVRTHRCLDTTRLHHDPDFLPRARSVCLGKSPLLCLSGSDMDGAILELAICPMQQHVVCPACSCRRRT